MCVYATEMKQLLLHPGVRFLSRGRWIWLYSRIYIEGALYYSQKKQTRRAWCAAARNAPFVFTSRDILIKFKENDLSSRNQFKFYYAISTVSGTLFCDPSTSPRYTRAATFCASTLTRNFSAPWENECVFLRAFLLPVVEILPRRADEYLRSDFKAKGDSAFKELLGPTPSWFRRILFEQPWIQK